MASPIRDLPLIQRNPATRRLDVKATMQAFAMELISWADEENAIRIKRKYREAIRGVFKRYDKATRIPSMTLIMIAMQDMQVTPSNFQKLQRELELHIKLNRGGYLRTVAGKGGGVELTKP
jgi:hypothetical protein